MIVVRWTKLLNWRQWPLLSLVEILIAVMRETRGPIYSIFVLSAFEQFTYNFIPSIELGSDFPWVLSTAAASAV